MSKNQNSHSPAIARTQLLQDIKACDARLLLLLLLLLLVLVLVLARAPLLLLLLA
jgi:hypothetical protein